MTAIDDLAGAVASFATAKIATTQLLTAAVVKHNAGTPVSSADLQALVTDFNTMTVQSNAVRSIINTIKSAATPPPAAAGVSLNGAAALPLSGTLTDHFNDVWSFGPLVGSGDYAIEKNGQAFQAAASLLAIYDGVVWGLDSVNNWWTTDPATNKWVTSLGSPFAPNPQPVRSWNTHDGAIIACSSSGQANPANEAFLIDMNAARWTFGAQVAGTKDFTIMRNGIPFAEPGFTNQAYAGVMMRLKNGIVYIQNAAGSWEYPPV